jgi:hypothetical protein
MKLLIPITIASLLFVGWCYLFSLVAPISYPTDCGTDEDWTEVCENWHEYEFENHI